MGRWATTILFLLGSVILTHMLPFSSFFRNVNTMVHEFGHAAATMLLSGKVMYIELYANHSGVTYSYIEEGWRTIPLALAGYISASLFAVYLFHAYGKGKLNSGFIAMSAVALVSLIFFVRNGFGVAWLAGFIAVNTIAMWIGIRWIKHFYYLLVAFICLEESVFSTIDLVYLSFMHPGQAGDATSLAKTTMMPDLVWSILFLIIALMCAKAAISWFIGRSGKRRGSRARKAAVS